MTKGLFLDFGGVVADEGYREGLFAIADRFNINRETFFKKCADLIYETGYIIGDCGQERYFNAIRESFGISINDDEFEKTILNSFKIRKNIIAIVQKIKKKGIITAILSDQTDWLDKLNKRENFFKYFDFVFNSYHIKMGKRDVKTFYYVSQRASLVPQEILFIDDQPSNIERARMAGVKGICLTDEKEIINLLKKEFSIGG